MVVGALTGPLSPYGTTLLGFGVIFDLSILGFGGCFCGFVVFSGIGIASGGGCSICLGWDCVNPSDSFARMFSVSTSLRGSGIAALLTSVALIAPPPEVDPPQSSP